MKKIKCNNQECEYCLEVNGSHYCSENECQYPMSAEVEETAELDFEKGIAGYKKIEDEDGDI